MKKKFFVFLISITLVTNFSFAQNRTIGISSSIQDNQFGILLPLWLGDDFVLAPAFHLAYAQNVGTEYSLGLVPRFYFKTEKVAPYLGFKIGTMGNIPSANVDVDYDKAIYILAGIAFGAEYFLEEKFSFGVEAQGNCTYSDEDSNRFGNPGGFNFNTATMITATVYF
jgi:hypothetical protein